MNAAHERRRIISISIGISMSIGSIAFAAADTAPPVIVHERVERVPIGEPIAVRAEIQDKSGIFAPSLLFRLKGSKEYDSLEMRETADGYVATIPAELVNTDLEYFIEAFDEHGNGPARQGSPEAPIAISVFDPTKPLPRASGPEPTPALVAELPPDRSDRGILDEWWFWAAVGVVVFGGGATAVILATQSGPVDRVDVLVRGPDPSEGL